VIFEHPVSYNFGLQIQGKNLESNEAATIRKVMIPFINFIRNY